MAHLTGRVHCEHTAVDCNRVGVFAKCAGLGAFVGSKCICLKCTVIDSDVAGEVAGVGKYNSAGTTFFNIHITLERSTFDSEVLVGVKYHFRGIHVLGKFDFACRSCAVEDYFVAGNEYSRLTVIAEGEVLSSIDIPYRAVGTGPYDFGGCALVGNCKHELAVGVAESHFLTAEAFKFDVCEIARDCAYSAEFILACGQGCRTVGIVGCKYEYRSAVLRTVLPVFLFDYKRGGVEFVDLCAFGKDVEAYARAKAEIKLACSE